MTEISGKRAFLALLKQEGVEILFGNPGTTELPLMDALAVESGLRYVLGLQEAAVLAMVSGGPGRVAPRLRGDHAAIDAGAALLAAAGRPVLIAGDAGAQSGAHAELVALAELLGAPVWAEGVPSTASFPASHPLFRGAMVRLQTAIREVLQQHDVLFSVGGDLFTLSLPSETEAMPPDLAIIQLDNDAWELGKNYPARVAILGDPKASLPELTAAVAVRMSAAQKLRAGERLAALKRTIAAQRQELVAKARAEAAKHPIRPLALLQAIGEALPAEAIVIDETISSGFGLRQFLKSDDVSTFYGLRGGGIRWGLPAAVGVKPAPPRRPVPPLVRRRPPQTPA